MAFPDKAASTSLVIKVYPVICEKKFMFLYYISVSFFFHFGLYCFHSVSNCPDQIKVNDRNQVTIYKAGLLIP